MIKGIVICPYCDKNTNYIYNGESEEKPSCEHCEKRFKLQIIGRVLPIKERFVPRD